MALQPTQIGLADRVWVSLEQGDLAGARVVVHGALRNFDSASVADAFTFRELGWVLDSALEHVLLRQVPSPSDQGLACALAQQYGYRGDTIRARAYAERARVGFAALIRAIDAKPLPTPLNVRAEAHAFYGLSLAYLGRPDSALAEGRVAVAIAREGWYIKYQLAKIYLLLNRPDDALDLLELAVKHPDVQSADLLFNPFYTPQYFRLDRNLARLHGNPRFERLIATPMTSGPPSA
jgi:tetratricopeptide (TPR) repeat protein